MFPDTEKPEMQSLSEYLNLNQPRPDISSSFPLTITREFYQNTYKNT